MRPFKLSVSIVEPSFFQTPIVNVEKAEESLRQSYEKLPSELKLQYGDAYVEQSASIASQYIHSKLNLSRLYSCTGGLHFPFSCQEVPDRDDLFPRERPEPCCGCLHTRLVRSLSLREVLSWQDGLDVHGAASSARVDQ